MIRAGVVLILLAAVAVGALALSDDPGSAKNGGSDSHTPPIITSTGMRPISTLAKGRASAIRDRLGNSCGRSPVGSREKKRSAMTISSARRAPTSIGP